MNYDDETMQILSIITEGFTQTKQKPVGIPQSVFAEYGLTFKKVNEVIDQFIASNVLEVIKRPASSKDKAHYELALTEHQKEAEKSMKNMLGHKRDMQMLIVYFGKVCSIYDAIAGGYMGFEDGQLNRYYTYLTLRLEEILAKEDFAELRNEMPEIYDSLLGSFEELDMAWEFMRPELFGFLGKLEKMWLKEAIGEFKLNKDEQKLLDLTDEAIKEHTARKKQANGNFIKRLEQEAPKMSGMNSEPSKKQGEATDSVDEPSKPSPKKIDLHPLESKHYSNRKGTLTLSPTVDVEIAIRGKTKRPGGKIKYAQCWLVEALFRNVNSLNNGITFSTFLKVKYDKNNKKHIKKIRNTIDEINKKVYGVGGPKRLIFSHKEKIYVDKSYLLKY